MPERGAGVRVRVPASSANLGAGFDAFAVALDRYVTVTVTPRGDQRVVTSGEGAGELPDGDDNLVWLAFVAFCDRAGADPPDVGLAVDNAIPLERGLGSSAAAAVAGAALARALTAQDADDEDIIAVAAELEGHADNAAAAVLGGLVVYSDGRAHRLDPSPDLAPVLCVPVERQATEAARGLLPAQVPLADAAANGARAALVLAGLTGMLPLDPHALRDVLHEPPRLAVMPESKALIEGLRGAGIAACLSGAGPSVLAIVPRGQAGPLATITQAAGKAFAIDEAGWDRTGALVTDV